MASPGKGATLSRHRNNTERRSSVTFIMTGFLYQFHTSLACSLGSLVLGMLFVWPSYTLPIYEALNNTVLYQPMTKVEASLVGSMPCLGGMLGTGLVGLVMETMGRKRTGVIVALPFVISWAAIQLSSSSILILVARFIAGIGGGAAMVFAPIFISEIVEDSVRGLLASLPMICYCSGVLCSYIVGWTCSYQTGLWVNITASVILLLLNATVTESPIHLLKKNKVEEAKAAMAHYRAASPTSKVVLDAMSKLRAQLFPAKELLPVTELQADEEKLCPKTEEFTKTEEPKKLSAFQMIFLQSASRRAFITIAVLIFMQVFMGMVPVQVFSKELFKKAAPSLSSNFCSAMFALVLLVASLVTGAMADKAGRKILIILSSCLVAICMLSMAVLQQSQIAPPWVSAVVMLCYCFSFYLGAGSMPYVLLAEVFTPEVQSLASTLLIEWMWLLNFFIIFIFNIMKDLIGMHGLFYIFAAMGAGDAVITFFILPETKGLSNLKIQELFRR